MTTQTPRGAQLLRPAYLTPADYTWIGRLIEEVRRLEGKKRGVIIKRLVEPMPLEAPKVQLEAAIRQIVRTFEEAPKGEQSSADLRAVIFARADSLRRQSRAGNPSDLAGIPAFQAAVLQASGGQMVTEIERYFEEYLYADIPSERIIQRIPPSLNPAGLAVAANGAMVARHLRRAHSVIVDIWGEVRRVIRQAKLRGLICVATRTERGARLFISGPLAVIHRTTYYGRALSELIPFLGWCPRFQMTAVCSGGRRPYRLRIESGDPLPPAPSEPRCDSRLEQQFIQRFHQITDAWDLIREPEPVVVPGIHGAARLVFPDFAAVQRTNPENRWLIEIVGFWTPRYLAAKLDGLRGIGKGRFILCVDDRLACHPELLDDFATVIKFKAKVPAAEVLRVIENTEV